MPLWTLLIPIIATALLAVAVVLPVGVVLASICALALMGAVIAAVHHAEVIAHRVGEPFGTLVLALAITIIETALIVSMMLAGGPDTATLPRDTIFAAIMIIFNGVVGLCLLLGGLRHHEQSFQIEGAVLIPTAPVPFGGALLYVPAEWVRPGDIGVDKLTAVNVSMGITPPSTSATANATAPPNA
jgi:Ca2+:H+ antiporter